MSGGLGDRSSLEQIELEEQRFKAVGKLDVERNRLAHLIYRIEGGQQLIGRPRSRLGRNRLGGVRDDEGGRSGR